MWAKSNSDTNSNAGSERDTHTYGSSNPDSDCESHRNPDSYANANWHCDADANVNCDANSYSHSGPDRVAQRRDRQHLWGQQPGNNIGPGRSRGQRRDDRPGHGARRRRNRHNRTGRLVACPT